jgi:hypothetical protein
MSNYGGPITPAQKKLFKLLTIRPAISNCSPPSYPTDESFRRTAESVAYSQACERAREAGLDYGDKEFPDSKEFKYLDIGQIPDKILHGVAKRWNSHGSMWYLDKMTDEKALGVLREHHFRRSDESGLLD